MSIMRDLVLTVLAAGLAIVITVSAFAASEFEGVWVVKD